MSTKAKSEKVEIQEKGAFHFSYIPHFLTWGTCYSI